MLTVLTWLWSQRGGKASYTAAHVNIWAGMVRRWMKSTEYRLACVTDTPEGIDPDVAIIAPPRDFEDVRIPTWTEEAGRPQCLRRLSMFRPDAAGIFGERFVCMDLDVVITAPIDGLFTGGHDFRMFKGTTAGRPYNGSMMLLNAGARPQVFDRFTPAGAAEAGRKYVGSDQAWISHVLGSREATWGEDEGVYWWNAGRGAVRAPNRRIVFFPGSPKPWDLVDRGEETWLAEHYRAGAQARPGLLLGYGPDVWTDLEAALDRRPFGGVIASPEVAKHWLGPVTAVARDDAHAVRLARMLGFEETVACGQQKVAA